MKRTDNRQWREELPRLWRECDGLCHWCRGPTPIVRDLLTLLHRGAQVRAYDRLGARIVIGGPRMGSVWLMRLDGWEYRVATIDHLVPLARWGAPADPANMVLACHLCNLARGSSGLPPTATISVTRRAEKEMHKMRSGKALRCLSNIRRQA